MKKSPLLGLAGNSFKERGLGIAIEKVSHASTEK
jgi:hypothetical protein